MIQTRFLLGSNDSGGVWVGSHGTTATCKGEALKGFVEACDKVSVTDAIGVAINEKVIPIPIGTDRRSMSLACHKYSAAFDVTWNGPAKFGHSPS